TARTGRHGTGARPPVRRRLAGGPSPAPRADRLADDRARDRLEAGDPGRAGSGEPDPGGRGARLAARPGRGARLPGPRTVAPRPDGGADRLRHRLSPPGDERQRGEATRRSELNWG